MFTVNTDDNGYILSIAHTKNDDTELNLDEMDLENLSAYRMINGVATLDTVRQGEISAEAEANEIAIEVADCKKRLQDTDYILAKVLEDLLDCTSIVDIVRLFASFKQNHREILSKRRELREYIEENEV